MKESASGRAVTALAVTAAVTATLAGRARLVAGGEGALLWRSPARHRVVLAAFRITAQERYQRRAFRLGELAIERFFGGSPLPRASLRSAHYEATTGADTLVLALTELHLATRQITAVRAPASTVDR